MIVHAKRSALVGGYLFVKDTTVEVSDFFEAEVKKNPFLDIVATPVSKEEKASAKADDETDVKVKDPPKGKAKD